jgi:dTDP-4-dehydrorhamnose reductase
MTGPLLIVGGSGYLGRALVRQAAASLPPDQFAYTYYSHDPLGLPQGRRLDLRWFPDVAYLLADLRPSAVIHAAGSNRIDDMATVITRGTAYLVAATGAADARLVYLSTDALFDGRAAPYDETAVAAPLHAYGMAKAEAERLVLDSYANSVVVRTSLIYGLAEMDHSTAWTAAALRAGEPVTLFSNQLRNPIWVESLAAACLELAGLEFTGVLNVAGEQALSRAAFGVRLLDQWGVTERDTLTIADDTSGRWPLDCRLDLSLAGRVLKTPLPGVDAVLAGREI